MSKKGVYSKSTYVTVAEMRANPEAAKALEALPKNNKLRNRRFEGSTRTDYVLEWVPKNAKVLECGPYGGDLTKFMQDQGYAHLNTLDFIDMITVADRTRIDSIHEVDFNSEVFPHSDNTFDAVVSFGMAEHLENPFHFFRETARVLRPGGLYIMAVPNVFHIISRLVFLRRGMFPRWSYGNNHIAIFPHGVFEKTILRDFNLVETRFYKPDFKPFLSESFAQKVLPANQWFGDYVCYFLQKK